MKLGKWFFVLVIALVAIMVLFETTLPKRFSWETELWHSSRQPFGLYVFDSVMAASVPQGYSLTGKSLPQIDASDDATVPTTYLIVLNHNFYEEVEVKAIRHLLERGNNFIFVFSYCEKSNNKKELSGLLGFSCEVVKYEYLSLQELLARDNVNDTITCKAYNRWGKAKYAWHNGLCNSKLTLSEPYQFLAQVTGSNNTEVVGDTHSHDDGHVNDKSLNRYNIAAVRQYAKGRVVVASTPWLFTNYGILDDNIRPYVMRVLSTGGNAPIVRIDDTLNEAGTEEESTSYFRYLLSHRPLRWALYMSLITVLLFMAFTVRRKQRVIPVMTPPENMSMAMVKHIGTLYYQRRDNADLLVKKCSYFAEQLRRKAMIDLDDADHFDTEVQALSKLTGIPVKYLTSQIHEVWAGTHKATLTDKQLKHLIDIMNNIEKMI